MYFSNPPYKGTDVREQMLENIHEMVCESKITYGIEVWGLSDGWKE